jgi:hypothetical protein
VVLTDLERVALMLAERLGNRTPPKIEAWAEERTPEEYRSQVETYLENCRGELTMRGRIAYLRHVGAAFTVELRNPTDQNLTDVELMLEFPIACEATGLGRIAGLKDAWDPPRAALPTRTNRESSWSDPPPPFGPRAEDGIVTWPPKTHCVWDDPPRDLQYLQTRLSIRAENLRPRATKRTVSYLVVAEDAWTEVPVGWAATATNVDGRLDGQFTVRVAGEPLSAAELLAPTLAALPDTTRGPWGYGTEVPDPLARVAPPAR